MVFWKGGDKHPNLPIIPRARKHGGVRRVPGHGVDGARAVALEHRDLRARLPAPDVDA